MKLGVLIPLHTPFVTAEWALSIRRLRVPKNTLWSFYRGPLPIDKARTALVKDALENECTHVLFLDSDVIPEPDAVETLLKYRYPITSGLYPDKGGRSNAWINRQNKWIEKGSMVVDEVGLGFCLIDTRVFKKIHPPWFVYLYNGGSEDAPSEDIFFCRLAKAFNFGVLVVGEVKCRHVGTFAMTSPDKCEHLRI